MQILAVTVRLQIQATVPAFAAILEDGSVVTWGDADHGGDCSAVQGQLRVSSRFKPYLGPLLRFWEDGSVVTWG